jgi:hypothetical protein
MSKRSKKIVEERMGKFIKETNLVEKDKAAFLQALRNNLPDVDEKTADKIYKEYSVLCKKIAQEVTQSSSISIKCVAP